MQQMKQILLTLVALLAVTTQAWAQTIYLDFEDGALPQGWTTSSGGNWAVGSNDSSNKTPAYAGTYSFYCNYGPPYENHYFVSPAINFHGGASLSFAYATTEWSNSMNNLTVAYSDSPTGPWTNTSFVNQSSNVWTTADVDLSALNGTYYIAFIIYDGMGYSTAIDNINLVVPAGSTTVTFTRGTGDKANEWTMVGGMPAANVTVNVEYWPGMLTLPAASEGGTVTLEGVTSNTIIDENFDDYTAGGKMAQTANAAGNSNWTTWSNAPGTDEDGTLATLNDNTCLQVIKDNDQVLLLGDKTSGMWEYSFDVYVPEGKFGYFNLLHDFDGVNSTWAFQCYLNANWEYDGENTSITYSPGHGTVHAGSESTADLPCVVNEWMHVSIVIDIDNDLAKLFFNGDFICEWQWSLESYGEDVVSGKLAACNFYGEGDEYYVDNIKFTQITLPAGFEIDGYGNIYVESGTQFTLVTTPAENYHLASLSDGTNTYNVDNDGKVTITMPDADLTLTAEFAENTYNVTFAEGVNPEAPADPVWTATPSTGVKKDDKVTVTYTGDRKVIGVRAEKKAEPTN
jgi:hypothetical protein